MVARYLRAALAAAALAMIPALAASLHAQGGRPLRFAISIAPARAAQPLDGRVLLFISDDGRSEPRMQSDQYRANSTRPIFGVDVDGLAAGADVIVDGTAVGFPVRSLKDIPPGDYFVQ